MFRDFLCLKGTRCFWAKDCFTNFRVIILVRSKATFTFASINPSFSLISSDIDSCSEETTAPGQFVFGVFFLLPTPRGYDERGKLITPSYLFGAWLS